MRNWIESFKKAKEPRALVLMYHRVADLSRDPWELAVSPQRFEEQLQVLSTKFRVFSINDLVEHYHNKSLLPGSVALSFDDGYSDNFSIARPLLERYHCPASFFIASHFVDQGEQFWWDELEQLVFDTVHLPESISIGIGGAPFVFHSGEAAFSMTASRIKEQEWRWYQPPPTSRCALYLALWQRLKPLPYRELTAALDELRLWASGKAIGKRSDLPMNSGEVLELARHMLFEVGLHTHTHLALAAHTGEVQRDELLFNKRYLEELCGIKAQMLTYPYGNYNEDTLQMARSLGLTAAFTTREQVLMHGSDQYQLGRFQVKNWDGPIFEQQLRRWLHS